MAKLPRINQKLFASTATLTEVGKFGSLAAGSPESAATTDEVQELNQFEGGWYSAILGNNNPAIQDMNGVFKLAFQQIAYILQQGIPEWIATTEYHEGSIVRDAAGVVYRSLTNDNLGNALTDTAEWVRVDGFSNIANYDDSDTAVAVGDAGKIILVDSSDGDVDLALPSAVGIAGRSFFIKKTAAANLVTMTLNGAEELDGKTFDIELGSLGDFIKIVSNGSNWEILNIKISPKIYSDRATGITSNGVISALNYAVKVGYLYKIHMKNYSTEASTTTGRKRSIFSIDQDGVGTLPLSQIRTNYRDTTGANQESGLSISQVKYYTFANTGNIRPERIAGSENVSSSVDWMVTEYSPYNEPNVTGIESA